MEFWRKRVRQLPNRRLTCSLNQRDAMATVSRGTAILFGAVVLFAGLEACEGVSPFEVEGEFAVQAVPAPPDLEYRGPDYRPEFEISSQGEDVVIEGSFWGDGCGNRLDPVFERERGELRFRLTFVVVIKNPTCLAWEAISIYTARFLEVPPGRYQVTVVHNNERLDEIMRFSLGMVTMR